MSNNKKRKQDLFSDDKMAELKADFCLGLMSIKVISEKYKISTMTVLRWAQELEWKRNSLSTEAKKRAGQEVRAALTKQDESLVANYADLCVAVIHTHKRDINSARGMALKLFSQLGQLCEEPVENNIDAKESLTSLSTKSRILRELTTSMALLQRMERTAYGITEEVKPIEEDDLQSIREKLSSLVATESGGAWQVN